MDRIFRLSGFSVYDLLIVLLIVAVILNNFIWLKLDQYPVEGHELIGVIPAVQVYRQLLGMQNPYTAYDRIFGLYNFKLGYPPLSYLILALFYLLFGLQGQMLVMVNSLYIAITLFSVYLIGKNLFSRGTGLLAAFILASFPGFIAFSRVYWIEFGLMAYVTLSLYLLLKASFFKSRRYSILLGISMALSFLHKQESIAFIIGPLLLVIIKSGIFNDVFHRIWTNRLKNLTFAIGLALSLSSFWWARYGPAYLANRFTIMAHGEQPLFTSLLSYKSLTFYLQVISFFVGFIFFAFFFLTLLITFVTAVIKKEKRFYIALLSAGFIIPYAFFTFITAKNPSHMFSILPCLALIISMGILMLRSKLLIIPISTLLIIFGMALQVSSFYSLEKLSSICLLSVLTTSSGFNTHSFNWDETHFGLPRKEPLESAIKDILAFIKSDSVPRAYPRAFVVYERSAFKNCAFEYYSLLGDYQINFCSSYHPVSALSECDYVIIDKPLTVSIEKILTNDPYPRFIEKRNFKELFKDGIKDYALIKIYKIPNGAASVYIYKRKTSLKQHV